MLGCCLFRKDLSTLKNYTLMTLKPIVLSVILGLSTIGILGELTTAARADSPITSTPFSEAYQDYKIVKAAKRLGVLTLEMAEYLSSPSNPIDVKAAIINGLSWKFEGKQNALLYRYYLGLKYGSPIEKLTPNFLTPDEVFSLGYLTVMDNYFRPEKAVLLLESAQKRKPKSQTIAMVTALTQAQIAMGSDWCRAWRLIDSSAQNSKFEADLRPQAKVIILDYMKGYQSSCK
jgi:hypothetical protein